MSLSRKARAYCSSPRLLSHTAMSKPLLPTGSGWLSYSKLYPNSNWVSSCALREATPGSAALRLMSVVQETKPYPKSGHLSEQARWHVCASSSHLRGCGEGRGPAQSAWSRPVIRHSWRLDRHAFAAGPPMGPVRDQCRFLGTADRRLWLRRARRDGGREGRIVGLLIALIGHFQRIGLRRDGACASRIEGPAGADRLIEDVTFSQTSTFGGTFVISK